MAVKRLDNCHVAVVGLRDVPNIGRPFGATVTCEPWAREPKAAVLINDISIFDVEVRGPDGDLVVVGHHLSHGIVWRIVDGGSFTPNLVGGVGGETLLDVGGAFLQITDLYRFTE